MSAVSYLCRDAIIIMLFASALAGHPPQDPLPEGLKEECVEFEALEFLGRYRKAEEKLLTAHYFGKNASRGADVVFAQRGSCLDYKDCFLAETSSFSTCRALKTLTRCQGGSGDSVSLLFNNCTRDQCELVLNPTETRCMYQAWRQDDGLKKAKGTCMPDPDDTLLKARPMSVHRPYNGSHCLLPVPEGSKILKQIECRDPGNEPWFRWWYDFSESLSKKPYACLLISSCQDVEDPLDFLCLSGKHAVRELKKIANKMPPVSLTAGKPGTAKTLTTAVSRDIKNDGSLLVPLRFSLIQWFCVVVVITGWIISI
ncbi:hypothetical protein BSKO_09724 [Bryopsis sp. KO-2023]|nr:hypothetical protein BSKO_09724 [Bryopsis sp. KO-2023]